MKERLKGVVVPMVTPLREDGSICEDGVARLIESVAGSACALLPALSSGEGRVLDDARWSDLVRLVVRHAHGLPVFPGAIVPPDRLAARAAAATQAGASGLALVVPSIPELGARAVVKLFARMVETCGMPVFVYSEQTAEDPAELAGVLEAICRIDGVVAVKESSRNPEVVDRLLAAKLPCAVFQGWEDLCLASRDADGYAVALANLEARACADMLAEPGPERQRLIDEACTRYQLFDEDWYAAMKTELVRRGVLASSRLVEAP